MTYLADRINVPAAELGIDRFEEILGRYNIDRKSLDEVKLILDTCNSARFAPGGASEESLSSLIERTESWIKQVDRFLEKKARMKMPQRGWENEPDYSSNILILCHHVADCTLFSPVRWRRCPA